MITLTGLVVATLFAQQAAASGPPPCSSPEHRQFDFWAGEWDVAQNGKLAGRNRIEKILGGCALLESWTGASGYRGHSLNFYDAARGVWHQTWIDAGGEPLYLEGRFENGVMKLSGKRPGEKGKGEATHRITWTPAADGAVRQLWETSSDGQTWTVAFDGRYERLPKS